MPTYRVCKSFTVESGHMLSKHAESCRFPHGHTRRIEVVLSCDSLDRNDMVVDFKVIKLALGPSIDTLDHRMAVNSQDPMLASMQSLHPDSVVIFENEDPTTEVIARDLYHRLAQILAAGGSYCSKAGIEYVLEPGRCRLDRLRVWETPTSWAEFTLGS